MSGYPGQGQYGAANHYPGNAGFSNGGPGPGYGYGNYGGGPSGPPGPPPPGYGSYGPPPGGNYGPPQSSPPPGGYGPPPGNYGPPQGGNYGPPQGGNYGPPQGSPPPSSYGPPHGGNYGPPQSGPPPGYGNYGSPPPGPPSWGPGGTPGAYNQHPRPPHPPPPHPPPPGLDAYGYPVQGGGYGYNARAGPPPLPMAPQHFGQGAPQDYMFQYSNCSGKRKALLIGINYFNQKGQLRGCINDVTNVSMFLSEYYNYKREDMVILTDNQANPVMQPTRANMIRAMEWLVKDAQPNDALFLHYSGHGGQTEDLDGDEDDGFDEVIYPVDFEKAGHIVDDEIHWRVVRPLKPGVRLTAIFDSCHSATAMDLPYIYSTKGILKEPNLAKEAGQGLLSALGSYAKGDLGGVASTIFGLAEKAYRGDEAHNITISTRTSPADVIMWSGSKDDQTSADAVIGTEATGAMSWAFIAAIKQNPRQSYVQLLNSIRDLLATKDYSQKPQLSCSHPLDTNLLFVM
ncbi:Metacaspase-1A [Tolypocladium capitatum]|uniref:Metacaspase-1A n=1 Tax=Tolypocladium capitatum TaxID=45235 RepID=A0A2K3QHR8_9HYPO|nr:Metacaspase-1A [Tolypocladium capitatum]